MNEALEKDMNRIARENGIDIAVLHKKLEEYKAQGFPEIAAWGRVKSAFSQDIKGIKDVYTIWPISMSDARIISVEKSWDDSPHDVVDLYGLFYGKVSKTNRSGFAMKVAVFDDALPLLDSMELGTPYTFKGAFNPRKGRLSMVRGTSFVPGQSKDCPDMEKVFQMALEDAVSLASLMDMDDRGNYKHDGVEIVFTGVVGDVRRSDKTDSVIFEISDIGSDIVTCWVPHIIAGDEEKDGEWIGKTVLGYGYHKIGDDGPVINARMLVTTE
ncbi:MAG: hypothetical protein JRJ78_14160 [Deltaproteobacteria bacterium]|nr:hypothetical protein [Deltaproteobacteria bacterium]